MPPSWTSLNIERDPYDSLLSSHLIHATAGDVGRSSLDGRYEDPSRRYLTPEGARNQQATACLRNHEDADTRVMSPNWNDDEFPQGTTRCWRYQSTEDHHQHLTIHEQESVNTARGTSYDPYGTCILRDASVTIKDGARFTKPTGCVPGQMPSTTHKNHMNLDAPMDSR